MLAIRPKGRPRKLPAWYRPATGARQGPQRIPRGGIPHLRRKQALFGQVGCSTPVTSALTALFSKRTLPELTIEGCCHAGFSFSPLPFRSCGGRIKSQVCSEIPKRTSDSWVAGVALLLLYWWISPICPNGDGCSMSAQAQGLWPLRSLAPRSGLTLLGSTRPQNTSLTPVAEIPSRIEPASRQAMRNCTSPRQALMPPSHCLCSISFPIRRKPYWSFDGLPNPGVQSRPRFGIMAPACGCSRTFWDAAIRIDPGAERLDEKRMPLCRAGELSDLWKEWFGECARAAHRYRHEIRVACRLLGSVSPRARARRIVCS